MFLENLIPEGYTIANGSEATKQVNSLGAGEAVSLAVTYAPRNVGGSSENTDASGSDDSESSTVQPAATPNSSNTVTSRNTRNKSVPAKSSKGKSTEQLAVKNDSSSNGNASTADKDITDGSDTSKDHSGSTDNADMPVDNDAVENDADNAVTDPATGKGHGAVIWIVLIILVGAGVVIWLVLKKKKSGQKLLSLFVCVAMVGTIGGLNVVPAKAEELQGRSVSISEKVTVGSTDVVITAIVKYDSVQNDTPADVGEISFQEPSADHIALDETTGNYFVDNEILVTGKDNASREEIERLLHEVNGNVVGCIEITNDYQVKVPAAMTASELDAIAEQLDKNEMIEDAVPHYLYETAFDAIPNDKEWRSEEWSSAYPEGRNWGVEAIDAMGAWEHCDEMSYVKVGIIDTTFDTSHEDLVYTKVWNNPDNIKDEESRKNETHGTHVSGTIAACFNNGKGIAGVAPKVTLYGYSILGSQTDNVVTDENKAMIGQMEIKYALALLITSNCKVINLSMGNMVSYQNSLYEGEIFGAFLKKLLNNGYDFLIVQSAGNDEEEAIKNGVFVAITDEKVKSRIMVVGAIGTRGSHKDGLLGLVGERVFDGYEYAWFSNFGDRVDVVAPGVEIYSAIPGNKYENKDGTSMAAPHVTGIATMCFAVNPNLTGAQVKSIIKDSAMRAGTSVTDTNVGHSYKSYWLVNAKAAVEQAIQTNGEAVSPINPSLGVVMGNVKGYDENHQTNKLRDVSVSAYRISDGDDNVSEYASAAQSDADGNYELILKPGTYYINIYKEGYLPFAICDVTVTNDQITYLDNVILTPDSGDAVSSIIHGTVRNALNGSSIEGVTVQLRAGWNNKNGELAKIAETGEDAITVTDSNGQYSIQMQESCYTAEFIKDGYITGYANVLCTSMDDADQDAVLTPVLSDDEYRIILTWSSTPRDLDSHISGPLSTGNRFHVYFRNMSAFDNGEAVATLDLDNTSGYGPETVTLKKTQDGVYKYAVHDYTNQQSTSSTALSMSGAKVELYCGNSLIATYNVPINAIGTVWNVFEIEGDTLRVINTMENNSNPATVCAVDTADAEVAAMAIDPDNDDEGKESDDPKVDITSDVIVDENIPLPENSSDNESDNETEESVSELPEQNLVEEPLPTPSETSDDAVTDVNADSADTGETVDTTGE